MRNLILTVASILLFSCTDTQKAPTPPTEETNRTDATIAACNPTFAIRRAELPPNWHKINYDLICPDMTTAEHYFVSTDSIEGVAERIRWNRANEQHINFDRSRDFILKLHTPRLGYANRTYEEVPYSTFTAFGNEFSNTYFHFLTLSRGEDNRIRVQKVDNFTNETAIFSVPFLKAVFAKHPNQNLGISIDSKGVADLRISNGSTGYSYYNISNDPSKSKP